MQAIPSLGSTEFERLLNRLAYDIGDAAIFRKLHADLSASRNDYWREFSQSQAFWSLSFQAYIEAVVYRLGRVYVSHKAALSLARWLEAIRSHPQLFSAPPDPDRLRADIESVREDDPVVKKLIGLRGNFVAHVNWENTADGGLRIGDRFALSFRDIDLLISRAAEILNRYSILFNRTSWPTTIVGQDDFHNVLKAVRADLERRKAEIAEEIERATRAASAGPDTDA